MQRWLWVTRPEFWEQLRGGQLDQGLRVEWTCDKDTRRGDVALLYRADLAKDMAYLFHVDDDELTWNVHPLDAGKEAPYCNATLVHPLRQPLLLPDLREEPRLDAWPALDLNFHGLAFDIPAAIWRVLLHLAHPLDRIALRRFGGG